MSRITHYSVIWISALIIIGYFPLYYWAGYYNSKFIADLVALMGISFMAASTAPVAFRALKRGVRSDQDLFIVSYWAVWSLVLVQRIWIILLAQAGRPTEWVESPISGLIALLVAMAAGYGGMAPLSGTIPLHKKEIIIFSLAAGFSGIMAGMAIGVFILSGWVN